MRYSDISNSDDIIDSRDVEKRIDELEGERESVLDQAKDSVYPSDDVPGKWGFTGCDSDSYPDEESAIKAAKEQAESAWNDSSDGDELENLKALRDDLEGYCPDWRHGVTLIRESYWVEYCKEYIKDCCSLNEIPQILQDNINWDGVAEDLQQDYTSGDYDGVTYWAR